MIGGAAPTRIGDGFALRRVCRPDHWAIPIKPESRRNPGEWTTDRNTHVAPVPQLQRVNNRSNPRAAEILDKPSARGSGATAAAWQRAARLQMRSPSVRPPR
jgi:hypothetical protein